MDDFCLEHGRNFMRCDQGPIPYCAKCEVARLQSPTPDSGTEALVKEFEDFGTVDTSYAALHDLACRLAAALEAQGVARDRLAEEITALREEAEAQAREIARLTREIEIRKAAASRFQLCPDHNGKMPLDGECVMCFTEQNERNRNRHEAKRDLDDASAREQTAILRGVTPLLLAQSMSPALFSDDKETAHRAASPWSVEAARNTELSNASSALIRLAASLTK